jgi:hypothetical protein
MTDFGFPDICSYEIGNSEFLRNYLSAELGAKSGTRAALVSAAEYHPVLSVAPEINDVRVLANRLSQVFDANEVLWSCNGCHRRLFAGVDAT